MFYNGVASDSEYSNVKHTYEWQSSWWLVMVVEVRSCYSLKLLVSRTRPSYAKERGSGESCISAVLQWNVWRVHMVIGYLARRCHVAIQCSGLLCRLFTMQDQCFGCSCDTSGLWYRRLLHRLSAFRYAWHDIVLQILPDESSVYQIQLWSP